MPNSFDVYNWTPYLDNPSGTDGLYYSNDQGAALNGTAGATFTGANYTYAIGSGTEYHVKKTGNDTTGTGTDALPFLTIKKGLESATTAGDTVTVFASGAAETLYAETGSYNPGDTSRNAVLRFLGSGTASERITLRANPGDESLIVIDCGSTKGGIDFNYEDYLQLYGIRFRNVSHSAIFAPNASGWDVDTTLHSKGCLIENNHIEDCVDPASDFTENSAIMRVFGLEDSSIINNKGISANAWVHGIMTFGQKNVIVKNNDIECLTHALYQKGFWFESAGAGVVDGMEISYNKFKGKWGVYLEAADSAAGACGFNWIHHNAAIITELNFVYAIQLDQLVQSTRLRINNNTVYGASTTTNALDVGFMDDVEVYGNIFANCKTVYIFRGTEAKATANDISLTEADYNVFEWSNTYFAAMDQYDVSPAEEGFTGGTALADWQAQTLAATTTTSLGVDTPDSNSTTSTSAAIFNTVPPTTDFTNKTGSPAIALLPTGLNAGCYETTLETEEVGLTSAYSAG